MSIVVIENERLRVGVAAHYGARVVSLLDKASGREWMTQGGQSADTGEDARYGGDEAVGWDECFPTVGAWDAGQTPWRRRLRDHGDLWGRPFAVERQEGGSATLSRTTSEFRFSRTLRAEGDSLVAEYAVENRAGQPLPFLWALHALLAVSPGDRLELPGIARVRASYLALGGRPLAVGETDWPGAGGALPFPLDEVQPLGTDFAAKFVISGAAGPMRVGRDGAGWLELSWSQPIRDVGLWMTYGAWPEPGGHEEIAIEPQSAPADDLGQAIAAGATQLAPGETREWRVTLRVLA